MYPIFFTVKVATERATWTRRYHSRAVFEFACCSKEKYGLGFQVGELTVFQKACALVDVLKIQT